MKLKSIVLASLLVSLANTCSAQLKLPELSPPGTVVQKVGFTTISVYYERPAVRGRAEHEIFGKLVPWNEVWRTGAGNCTKIAFSTDVIIEGQTVPRGTYSLFTIPRRKDWTVILNTDTVSYGTYSYDQRKDVIRFIVPAERTKRFYESLTIDIDPIPNDAKIHLSWLNTSIGFYVRTGADQEIMGFIDRNLITHKSEDAEAYEMAIEYYQWHQKDRKQVMSFVDRGIQLKEDRVWYYWKVTELMKEKKYPEALEAAHVAIDIIRKSSEGDAARKIELIRDFEGYIAQIRKKHK